MPTVQLVKNERSFVFATVRSRHSLKGMHERPSILDAAGVHGVRSLLLAACGGGGADTTPAVAITSVKVMGDRLADSDTFGYQVHGASDPTAIGIDLTTPRVYPELIARSYGLPALRNVYAFTGTTFIANPTQTGCTNSAIGGGCINNYSAPASPQSIPLQLANASAVELNKSVTASERRRPAELPV